VGNVAASITSTPDNATLFPGGSFNGSGALAGGDNPDPTGINHPNVTLYAYDPLNNLLCVEQHGNVTGTGCSASPGNDATSPWRVRRFTYNSLSQLLTAKNPESGTIAYSYDPTGNVLQKTSPAANQAGSATQTISYCYDELGRVTGKAYSAQNCTNGRLPSGTAVVSYFYDQASYQNLATANGSGQLTGISDLAGTGAYSFDAIGRIVAEQRSIGGQTKSMSYEYNPDGSIKFLHYPSGAVVAYTADSAGRTVSAVDSGHNINYATGATYAPSGALTGFISGDAITNSFSYNKRLQPVFMSASTATQGVFSIGYDFHLGNGNNSNVFAILNNRDHSRDQTFTYDALNRLTSAQNAGTDCTQHALNGKTEYWGNSYGYDAWGNLLQKTITKCGAESMSATADARNWIHAPTGADYQYDAAGNMTYDASGQYYSYDQENRITGAGGYTYTYDADGNRVKKANGSTGTLYWYMSPGIVAESDLNGVTQSEYVFFDGERVARKDFPSNAVSYYFSDHLKTADIMTDAQGNITKESDFYPWGGELQFVNNDKNDYLFDGHKRDIETGLDYFGARYYSNGLGRFITPDWSSAPVPVPYADFGDPQSLNLYTNVRNIPTSQIDGDGHCPPCPLGPAMPAIPALSRVEDDTAVSGGTQGLALDAGLGIVKAGPQLMFNNMVRMPLATIIPPLMPLVMKLPDREPFRSTNQTQADASFLTQLFVMALLPTGKGSTSGAPELPAFDGKTTQGILVLNEGKEIPLSSGNPVLPTYVASGHVEGKAALAIAEEGSTGGTLYHNNTNGTCGYCHAQIETLLPHNTTLNVSPPENAVANNSRAVATPTTYTGNAKLPKQPQKLRSNE
jgi:RHS repeat-associated protein